MSSSPFSEATIRNEILSNLSQATLPERPKRPLSAYNIFFRDTRRKVLQNLPGTRKKSKNDGYYSKRGPHGKIGFADLARTIGAMWKSTTPEEREVYEGLAAEDRKRYDQEMAEWSSIMEGTKNSHLVEEQEKAPSIDAKVKDSPSSIDAKVRDSPSKQEKIRSMLKVSVSQSSKFPDSQEAPQAVDTSAQDMPIEVIAQPPNMESLVSRIMESIETLKCNHDTEKLSAIVSFLIHILSDSVAEPTNHTGENTRKPSANPENADSVTTTSIIPMSHAPMETLGTHLACASFMGTVSVEEEDKKEAPISPKLTGDYTNSYSWLANHMGTDDTAFFIDMFQE